MWARLEEQCEAVRRADPELARELLASATARGAELEGITAVLLLTDEDDFNALAAAGSAGAADGPVYRLPSHGVVAPYTGGEILFGTSLTRYHIGHRYAAGAPIFTRPADSRIPAGSDLLFLVRATASWRRSPRSPPAGRGRHHDPPQPRDSRFVISHVP